MNDRTKIEVIDKLRKILKKTEEAGCTPEEAQSAFRMAARLMAEHNIEMAEVGSVEAADEWVEGEAIGDVARWTMERALAASICRRHFFVRDYFTRPDPFTGRKTLRFFGTPANVEAARFVFAALLDAFGRLFSEYRAASGCAASDRRIFIAGVAQGFGDKLEEERKAAEIERDLLAGKSSGSTAIVLASVAQKTLQAYRKAHPGMKPARTSYRQATGSQSTLQAGYEAGRSLNLRRQVGAGSKKGLPQR